jgi:hypothetical protein
MVSVDFCSRHTAKKLYVNILSFYSCCNTVKQLMLQALNRGRQRALKGGSEHQLSTSRWHYDDAPDIIPFKLSSQL